MTSNRYRGEVVWANDVFKPEGEGRPWLIISNGDQPFDDQHIAILLTTTERPDAYPIDDEDMAEGELPKDTYASPWVVMVKEDYEIHDHCGEVKEDVVDDIVDKMETYVSA